jgi:mannosylglycoprotein endo-beta-mannosidase
MKTLLSFIIILIIIPVNLLSQSGDLVLPSTWKAKRASEVMIDGTVITDSNFKPEGWIDAVVPGTILTTLLHNNLIPDPFFGMNNNLIPDVYDAGRDYYTYWFYNEFKTPEINDGQEVWLSFRGINYFADIFINGRRVNTDTHEGMYLREKYLITSYLNKGQVNRLAVWVAPPDPAGQAYAGQGGDGTIGRSVTMQFTAGWDWICPIRDRNTGIWDKVNLEVTGSVDIRNPFVRTRVSGVRTTGSKQEPAFVQPSAELKNVSDKVVKGTLTAELGKDRFSSTVTLAPNEEKEVSIQEFKIINPLLWWPNGMGEQPLYTMKFEFTPEGGTISDRELTTFGIRETKQYFDEKIKARTFLVNGQKVFIKGGNWIASDALMRLSKERYDAEVRLHAGMHMNMIRVWGGGLTERPEFYDACDKYGVLVWQDLWISGDCNGEWPDPAKKESQARRKAYPDKHSLFLESVADQVKMLRNHPSLYLWCGSNETLPPADILQSIENKILPSLDPGRFFLPYSTSPVLMTNTIGGVGDGPYGIREPESIFTEHSFPFNPETGSIGIPNYDGLQKIIPEDEMIPPKGYRESQSWNYHKYLPLNDFPDRYGKVTDIRDFCRKAQIVSYEQYRALQEAYNYKMWDWYTGMLVWKNQNPWTALRGFFYDYYLDYAGGYFGYKHGAEPVHIQLNLNDSVVCVLNQTAADVRSAKASIQLFDIHGHIISEKSREVSINAGEVKNLEKVLLPASPEQAFFLRLTLTGAAGRIDENLYWLSNKKHSYEKLNDLNKTAVVTVPHKTDPGHYLIDISNPGTETAFFIRLKVRNADQQLVLPAFFSENYITLFPGEKTKVELDLSAAGNIRNTSSLSLVIEGWNVQEQEVNF